MDTSAFVVTGFGAVVGIPCEPAPFLHSRKTRKFMGPQDDLAVTAAGRALASAGLAGARLGERAGLFMAVGHIPFERPDIDLLLAGSLQAGRFDMTRFSRDGCTAVNPLITFRCLSNMPAFHVSLNFGVRGPYLVGYPGAGQFYLALEEAAAELAAARIDVALVAGVAHQRNWLVEHHFSRVVPPVPPERLADAAGCLILESPARARLRGAATRARLLASAVRYHPHHPFEDPPPPREKFEGAAAPCGEPGPASLAIALAGARGGRLTHRLETRDGFLAWSEWEIA